jgi:hypothetical protein
LVSKLLGKVVEIRKLGNDVITDQKYSNIYPTNCNVTQFIFIWNCSTCFRWYHHPSSGVQTTVSTASGICHTVTAICRYCGRVGTLGVPTVPR